MDQVKEYLRLAIKYRFWIVVGVAALMPMIAYAVASGPINKEAEAKKGEIESADKDVKTYASGTVPNEPYKKAVEEKTEVLTDDVNKSWRKLYERQAPLLQWPKEVEAQFKEWGKNWPKGVAPTVINETIFAYVENYPREVEKVYQSVHPFDFEKGTGIVVAPPKEALLRPAPFDVTKSGSMPTLGKVWAAQEKLWIQGVVLDVIEKVNQKAKSKDWDTAIVKQINELDVASQGAQDQRSMAEGKALELAPDITDPDKPAAAADAAAPAAPAGGDAAAGAPGGYGGKMMMGMGSGMGMGMGSAAAADEVYYLPSTNKDQYNVVPIFLSVLIDQERIPDLLVEFQNSPMNVQVLECEVTRPKERVRKPEAGEAQGTFVSGYGGGYGRSMGMLGGMGAYPGMGGGYPSEEMGRMGYPGAGGGYPGPGAGGYPGGGGYGYMGGTAKPKREGVKVEENAQRKKKAQEKDKEAAKKKDAFTPKIADPFFNIVELRIYGQARFYNSPPAEQPKAEATSEAPAGDAEAAKDKADESKKDEAKKDAAKADDQAEAEKKDEAKGKDDAAKKDEPAKDKGEQPKAEAPPEADKGKKDEPAKDKKDEAEDKDDAPKPKDESPKR
jgi:hypothetical protein